MRVTVPARPLVTQAPSGLTATSTASTPMRIRRPLPGTSGSKRVTVPSPALAVHTDPSPTASRSGDAPAVRVSGARSSVVGVERDDAVVAPADDPDGRILDATSVGLAPGGQALAVGQDVRLAGQQDRGGRREQAGGA